MSAIEADIVARGARPAGKARIRQPSLGRLVELAAVHAVLLAGAAFILMPFAWLLITSVRPPAEIFEGTLRLWPRSFHGLTNYSNALSQAPLLRYMLNGAIVCCGILAVQLMTAIPCAYALAKLPFRARPVVFATVILCLCVPIQVPALPIYIALAEAGLLNSYFALMFPFFVSVFAIFLFRQVFKSYPDDILNAARIDGLSELEILWRLVVPSAWPAIAAFSVFSFVAHWNDLYWPLIVVTSPERATPPLGVLFFRNNETGADYGALMAAAALVTAPLVIGFLNARRLFLSGITMTGIR